VISTGVYIPVADTAQYFSFGGGGDVNLSYQVPRTVLVVLGGISYAYTLGQSVQTISLAAAEVGVGVRLPITSWLGLFAYGTGGYWYGTFNDLSASSTDPFAGVGLEFQLSFSPTFGLSLGAQYKDYFGLWEGLSAGVGMRVGFGSRGTGMGVGGANESIPR
jgi:hypothetical protein